MSAVLPAALGGGRPLQKLAVALAGGRCRLLLSGSSRLLRSVGGRTDRARPMGSLQTARQQVAKGG